MEEGSWITATGYLPYVHLPPKYAPKQMLAAASVNSSKVSLFSHSWIRKAETPLKCDRKSSHINKSRRAPIVIRTLWYGLVSPVVSVIKRLMNARPGAIALHKKFSEPTKDCTSTNVILDLHNVCWICGQILCTLTAGTRISIYSQTKIIMWLSGLGPLSFHGPVAPLALHTVQWNCWARPNKMTVTGPQIENHLSNV